MTATRIQDFPSSVYSVWIPGWEGTVHICTDDEAHFAALVQVRGARLGDVVVTLDEMSAVVGGLMELGPEERAAQLSAALGYFQGETHAVQ